MLIHSENGDNRAVCYAAAYLVHRFHWPPDMAVEFVNAKRPCVRLSNELRQQLWQFAERRRAKYGNFKNIFATPPPSRMNAVEILHRNTFLNIVGQQPQTSLEISQKSPVQALIDVGVIKSRPTALKWRDGLTATQPPARFAAFNL